jgi:hypothetical protein
MTTTSRKAPLTTGLVDPGEYLDQGGFAGAVLADERVDLSGSQRERHLVEGFDAEE